MPDRTLAPARPSSRTTRTHTHAHIHLRPRRVAPREGVSATIRAAAAHKDLPWARARFPSGAATLSR
eukprot:217461-Prymnesium_polylepis.1